MSFPRKRRRRRRGYGETGVADEADNAVNVVGHDDKRVEFNKLVVIRQIEPAFSCDQSALGWFPNAAVDFAERVFAVSGADRDKVGEMIAVIKAFYSKMLAKVLCLRCHQRGDAGVAATGIS